MTSDPNVRALLEQRIKECGTITADSIGGVMQQVGMKDVSITKFRDALQSLHFNPGPVHVCHPHMLDMQPRPYTVRYLAS